jgi:transcriptional regulator with XRE-family HTH domain
MRKSRGLTLQEVADLAGVSLSSVKKLESSGDGIHLLASTLDEILTAMATRAPLGPSEIDRLCAATDRRFESFEGLNEEAERRKRAAEASASRPTAHEPSVEERITHAVHLLLAAGMGESVMVQLEALAALHGEQIAERERTPRRTFSVVHPERQVGNMIMRDISHYAIDDDDPEPRRKQPIDEPQSQPPEQDDDRDTSHNTGS